jgi:hypothetical protein
MRQRCWRIAPAAVAGRVAVGQAPSPSDGEAPPLPRHLAATGIGWLVAAIALIALSLLVFTAGRYGRGVAAVGDHLDGEGAGLNDRDRAGRLQAVPARAGWGGLGAGRHPWPRCCCRRPSGVRDPSGCPSRGVGPAGRCRWGRLPTCRRSWSPCSTAWCPRAVGGRPASGLPPGWSHCSRWPAWRWGRRAQRRAGRGGGSG